MVSISIIAHNIYIIISLNNLFVDFERPWPRLSLPILMVVVTFEGLIEKVFYHTIIPPTITGTTIFFLPLTKIILIIEVHTAHRPK